MSQPGQSHPVGPVGGEGWGGVDGGRLWKVLSRKEEAAGELQSAIVSLTESSPEVRGRGWEGMGGQRERDSLIGVVSSMHGW